VRDREAAEKRGHTAETVALWFLRLKGYRLLARRFKCASGEVDLVMRKGHNHRLHRGEGAGKRG
jgi:putative endonuclease